MNLLAISVGNTRTRLGVFVEGKLTERRAVLNAEFQGGFEAAAAEMWSLLSQAEAPAVVVAAVHRELGARAEAWAQRGALRGAGGGMDVEVLRVERDLTVPVGRQLDPQAIVGEDRLLNAAAAYGVLKQACVVVDAGTAITLDFVDGAGTFHGGAIAPGGQMMLDALHRGTDLLPEVKLALPAEAIGHNTQQAMLVGVVQGIRGMLRQVVEGYAELAGAFPMVVATGGDAELLFGEDPLVDRIVPDLTLLGMAATLRAARGEPSE
jgi:type III pantothenate kinase